MNEGREAWRAAHGPIPKGWNCHHLNGDKRDCRLENLAVVPRYPEHQGQVTAPYTSRIKKLERLLKQSKEQT